MAEKRNFYIDAGADFELTLTVDNENIDDLDDFTATSKLKKHYLAASNTAISFTCSIDNGSNTVTISMPHATTANIEPGRYVYDIILTSTSNSVIRLLEGLVTVNPKVT